MLNLHGKLPVLNSVTKNPYLVTVVKCATVPMVLRNQRVLIRQSSEGGAGYKAVMTRELQHHESDVGSDVFRISAAQDYLQDGDIIRLDSSSGAFSCLYRKNSPNNTILLTEQCDHYCLMCSQPPKNVDDSWLLKEAFDLIDLIPLETERIGFSGGEPTLYGDKFIKLLHHTRRTLPGTGVDILSNGRAFKDREFAREYASVAHPNMLIGIPIYSDDPVRHDYVVQSKGAFDETVRGIVNLKELKQKVEIRVVIHKQTIERLVKTCEFIARNLLFVDHVALMGLEITGFTRPNLDILWVDPYEYKDTLSEAVAVLNSYGMEVSVYNHQLCTINSDIFRSYRKSISDWKTEYLPECLGCSKRGDCGGLFSSSKQFQHSRYIKSFA